jgi:Cu/Ag efflux pump CusA
MDSSFYRPATYIESAMGGLTRVLAIGAALLVVVLGALLLDARATIVACCSILVSFMLAGLLLAMAGVPMNLYLLAGLVMAAAAVIDDAVVDSELVARRVRQRRQSEADGSFATLIVETCLSQRRTLIAATLVLLLITAPAFLVTGVLGKFLQTIAIGYGVALVSSLATALLVTPGLSTMLLPGSRPGSGQSSIVAQLQNAYGRLLSHVVENPRPYLAASAVLSVAAIVAVARLERKSFLPTFHERDVVVEVEAVPGTSHTAMSRIARQATRELKAIPGVRLVSANLGRAVLSDQIHDLNRGEIWISLDRDCDYQPTVNRIRQVMDGFAGLDSDTTTYLKARVSEKLRGGQEEDIVVRVYGDDLDALVTKADEIKKALAQVDGVSRAEFERPLEEPQIEIEVKLEEAKKHGIKPGDVRRAAATLISGIDVGYLFEEQKVFEVVVWGIPEIRQSLDTIRNLTIDAPNGDHVRLQDVADVRIASSPTVIQRNTVSRYVDVGITVSGRSLANVESAIRSRLNEVDFPLEYRAEVLSGSAERVAAQRNVTSAVIAAVIGVLLLFQVCTRRWSIALALFATVPAAAIGSVIAAYLLGNGLTLGAAVGILAVVGLAIRNGLSSLESYYELAGAPRENASDANGQPHARLPESHVQQRQQLADDAGLFATGVAQRGSWARFTPILITAAATAAALLPIAALGDSAGGEILTPMSIVMLAGLISSLGFSLISIPAMYVLLTSQHPGHGEEFSDSWEESDEIPAPLIGAGRPEAKLTPS